MWEEPLVPNSAVCYGINDILTLGIPPGVGVLTCRHQIPCVSPLNLAWGSGDVVDRCFTHKFLYYCHIYKKSGMLLHTKLNNSQMYFRDIPIDYHDL